MSHTSRSKVLLLAVKATFNVRRRESYMIQTFPVEI